MIQSLHLHVATCMALLHLSLPSGYRPLRVESLDRCCERIHIHTSSHTPRPRYSFIPVEGNAETRYTNLVPSGGSSGILGLSGQPLSRLHSSIGHSATHVGRLPPRTPSSFFSCSSDLQKQIHLHARDFTSARVFNLFRGGPTSWLPLRWANMLPSRWTWG